MERVAKIRLQHIRPHEDSMLSVDSGVTVISGPNGSGKTSIIEALYVALQGTSFKGGDNDILQHNASWYRIDVWFEDGLLRTVKFDPSKSTGRKQFIVNDKASYRLSPLSKYPVVLFDPDDLRLLHGSPVRRRQFIDRFIAQLDPKYAMHLRRYERALKQRNSLLKQEASRDALFAWDVSLSEYGAYIIAQRQRFISNINDHLQDTYQAIAQSNDTISVAYSFPVTEQIQQRLLAELHTHLHKDSILGATSVGPHRHDIHFSFNDSSAMSVASRGEVRSIVLALKFLEVEIITKITGQQPIILLDDVFSELDTTRQASLASGILHNQTIITTTTPINVEKAKAIELANLSSSTPR